MVKLSRDKHGKKRTAQEVIFVERKMKNRTKWVSKPVVEEHRKSPHKSSPQKSPVDSNRQRSMSPDMHPDTGTPQPPKHKGAKGNVSNSCPCSVVTLTQALADSKLLPQGVDSTPQRISEGDVEHGSSSHSFHLSYLQKSRWPHSLPELF